MKISIIMPVYNSEEFIVQTINSIINQTYKDWELIIIDDCSKDNSYELAKELSKSDDRIKVYKNEENLGISGNRNKGLKIADGDYIAFCDDDDIFTTDLLEDNVKILLENKDIDIIKFGRKLLCVDSKGHVFEEKNTFMEYSGIVEEENKYKLYFKIRKSDTFFNLWNCIYRKKMLIDNNIQFDQSMKFGGEDADFSYKCYLNSKRIYINPQVYYYHYKRDISSTSRKYDENKIHSIIKAMNTEFNIWKNIDFNDIYNQYHRIIALNINLNNIMFAQFFHKKSDLNYKKRKELYNIIREKTLEQNYIVNKEVNKMLWKKDKKNYIITKVIKSDNYFFIDMFYKLSAILKNRKWK